MKRPLFPTLCAVSFFVASNVIAADPATDASPPSADSWTESTSASDAWQQIQTFLNEPGSLDTDEQRSAFFGDSVKLVTDFIERYPKAKETSAARLTRARLMLNALQLAKPEMTADDVIADLRDLVADGTLPPEAKPQAYFVLLQYVATHRPSTELAPQLDRYDEENPEAPLPLLAKAVFAAKLEDSDPERAKQMKDEVEKEQAEMKAAQEKAAEKMKSFQGKPIELKFTAVDGREVDLQGMKGKVVLVDFWATWCGPCVAEIPSVLAAYEKYHDQGFEIVGVSFDRDKESLLKMTKEKSMPWPQYFHEDGGTNPFGEEFGIRGIPTMWLVNKDGVLADLDGRHDLDEKVARLLAE